MDKQIKRIGTDRWNRPVFQGESGKIYCDINLGKETPKYCTKLNNDFDGEPDLPMPKNWNPTILESKQKKQVIKINENQLKQIVTESVKRVLKENIDGDSYMSWDNDLLYELADF